MCLHIALSSYLVSPFSSPLTTVDLKLSRGNITKESSVVGYECICVQHGAEHVFNFLHDG